MKIVVLGVKQVESSADVDQADSTTRFAVRLSRLCGWFAVFDLQTYFLILHVQSNAYIPFSKLIVQAVFEAVFKKRSEDQRSNLQVFEGATSEVRAISQGQQKFAVFWHRADTASDQEGAITLEYSSDGTLIRQGTLVPRW